MLSGTYEKKEANKQSKTKKLTEHFIAGTTARCGGILVAVNFNGMSLLVKTAVDNCGTIRTEIERSF